MDTTTEDDGVPLLGAVLRTIASGDGTAEAFEAFRLDLRPGARSPQHRLRSAKLFVVTAGTVTIVEGVAEAQHGVGAAVLVPAGTDHCYRNDSGEDAAVVVVTGGTGQLAFLRAVSALAAEGPVEPSRMRDVAAAHDVVLAPPRA